MTTTSPSPRSQRGLSVPGATVDFPQQEGPAMTTTTIPNVPIPAGAVSVQNWDRGGRLFYGAVSPTIPASGWMPADVRISTGGVQDGDGTYEWEICVGPLDPDNPLTAAQARQIGEALIAAADELDALA